MVGDGPTRADCEELARALGVKRAVFPGTVAHDRVSDYLHAIDVAVIPSGSQPGFHYSPLKLKEYLATGRATVAPRVGEMLRVMESGSDALLYEPGDLDSMAAAIETLVEDGSLRTEIGQRGRDTYDRLFTMDLQLDLVAEKLRLPTIESSPPLLSPSATLRSQSETEQRAK
jgi:glycosyltransferase involved in cell wall biosynthesis